MVPPNGPLVVRWECLSTEKGRTVPPRKSNRLVVKLRPWRSKEFPNKLNVSPVPKREVIALSLMLTGSRSYKNAKFYVSQFKHYIERKQISNFFSLSKLKYEHTLEGQKQ